MSQCRRFAVVLLFLVAALPLAAQAPKEGDLLEETKQRQKLTAQKAEADFRAAFTDLHRLSIKDPARAAERFEELLVVLEGDDVLNAHTRDAWKRMLQGRVRVLKAEATEKAKGDADKAGKEIKIDERRTETDRKADEEARAKAAVDNARRLQNEGRSEEATRAAADAAKRFPNNPAALAGSRIAGAKKAQDDMRTVRDDKARRTNDTFLEVERSSMPPKGDIEFPSPEKWRDITKRRSKSNITEAEKAIMKALESPITANFKGSTFEEALNTLQTLTGQTIITDKATLDAAGLAYDTPLNTQVKGIALRTLLRKILGQFNLTYVVKDQVIQIVSPEKAKEMMTVRTYYLGDMAFVGDFQFGPANAAAQMYNTVAQLIQTIVGTVEPDSWAVNNNGGKGTIVFDARTLSLIVKQSAEIHYMMGGFGK